MKLALAILLLAVSVQAQTNAVDTLTTTNGKVYKAVKVLGVEPDGLSIQYAPEPGAMGMAKVKFAVLPETVQKQYGYDPEKAYQFERAKAIGDRRHAEYLQRLYDDANKRIQERRQREAEAEKAAIELREKRDKERLALELRIREVQAKERQADNPPSVYINNPRP